MTTLFAFTNPLPIGAPHTTAQVFPQGASSSLTLAPTQPLLPTGTAALPPAELTTQPQPSTPARGGEEEYGPFELCLEHVNRGLCTREGCLKQHVDLSVWGHPDLAADYGGPETGMQRLCPLYFLTGYCRLYGSRVPLLLPNNSMGFLAVKAQGRRMKETRCLFRHDVDPVYAYPPTFCKRRLPVHVEQLREWWFRERMPELARMWLEAKPTLPPLPPPVETPVVNVVEATNSTTQNTSADDTTTNNTTTTTNAMTPTSATPGTADAAPVPHEPQPTTVPTNVP